MHNIPYRRLSLTQDSVLSLLLLHCRQQLIARRDAAHRLDPLENRRTLVADSLHRRANRIAAAFARRSALIAAVEGEIGLIQLANRVAVRDEHLSALLHIGFRLIDLARRQQ